MKVVEINETTRLPLSIVATITVCVFGGAGWATSMAVSMSDAQATIVELKADVKEINVDREIRRDQFTNRLHNLELNIVAIREHLKIPPPRGLTGERDM